MFRVMFVSKCIDILHIFRLYQNNKILGNRINTAFLCLWDFSDIISEQFDSRLLHLKTSVFTGVLFFCVMFCVMYCGKVAVHLPALLSCFLWQCMAVNLLECAVVAPSAPLHDVCVRRAESVLNRC